MSPNLSAIRRMFGDKLAPNGLPIHENFLNWFGESKVVDDSGRPLVVYHGTQAEIDQFNVGEEGVFFSPSAKVASSYAQFGFGDGSNVMPVYLSLNNPLIVDAPSGRSVAANYYDRVAGDLQKQARADGHDGIIVREMRGRQDHSTYVAFRPDQIKSATGNNGNFDSGNKYITQSASHDAMISGADAIAAMNPVELDNLDAGFIKDSAGLPVTLYHGGLKWDLFDSGKSGRDAIWLTPDVSVASGYADQYSESDGREIKAFHVSMRKPLDLRDCGVVNQVFGAEELPEAHEIARDRSLVEQALRYAKDRGYDGLIHPDSDNFNRYTNGQVSYAVFSQDQLQLAPLTGNEQDHNTYGIALRGKDSDPSAQISDELGSVIRERIRA